MEAIQAELDKMAMHEDRLDVIDNWIEDHRVLVQEWLNVVD